MIMAATNSATARLILLTVFLLEILMWSFHHLRMLNTTLRHLPHAPTWGTIHRFSPLLEKAILNDVLLTLFQVELTVVCVHIS